MENLNLSTSDLELLDNLVEEALNTTVKVSSQTITSEQEASKIKENSKTMEIKDSISRFSSAAWVNEIQKKSIILAGCGGIGSWVGLLMGRLLPKSIILIDDDQVDSSNIGGQFFSSLDVNSRKVEALAKNLRYYATYHSVSTLTRRYGKGDITGPIMICGFDNMEARSAFFHSWKDYINSDECKEPSLFIDGRLAAEELQIFCIEGGDLYNIERYEKEFLFTDSEADNTICSYKQTSFCANMIASLITNLFVNFCANLLDPVMRRDVPFFTSYNAETMFLKTEA